MTKVCFNAYNREEFMWYCKKYDVKDTRIGTPDYEWWFRSLLGDKVTWIINEDGSLGASPQTIKETLKQYKDSVSVNKRFELGQMQ